MPRTAEDLRRALRAARKALADLPVQRREELDRRFIQAAETAQFQALYSRPAL